MLINILRDTIQPFPTFSETYVTALNTLRGEITGARKPERESIVREESDDAVPHIENVR